MRSTKITGFKLDHVFTAWEHAHHVSPQATHTGRRWWLISIAATLFLLTSGFYFGLIP